MNPRSIIALLTVTTVVAMMAVEKLGAQHITGTIRDTADEPLEGATIVIEQQDSKIMPLITNTGHLGTFTISVPQHGAYIIKVSHVGYKAQQQRVEVPQQSDLVISLEQDILGLEEVIVTGTLIPDTHQQSSISLSIMDRKDLNKRNQLGVSAMLQNEPGIYSDASAGEVFTRVYTRGVSISAEDDMGWYYTSLQEDGLPVTAVQFASFAPDLFYRVDNMIDHVETLRGGSSSITGMNSPGGIVNFISRSPSDKLGGTINQQFGVHANGNTFLKTSADITGPINEKWSYLFGGHFRNDQGARNTEYQRFSRGGQLKANLSRKIKNGNITFRLKYLDDRVNRWTGVVATNWENPQPAFGQNFLYTAQLAPKFNGSIPDGEGGTYAFDPSRGIRVKEKSAGLQIEGWLNKWRYSNQFKYSTKSATWQTSLANAKVDLNSPLPYFISGAGFPIGMVVFRNTRTGAEMARIDNSGVLNPNNPSFTYLTPNRLPFDAVLGTSAWFKDDENTEFMNNLSLTREIRHHTIYVGIFAASSKVKALTRASFIYATFEPQPVAMNVTLENPGQPVLQLSDPNGLSNYGGLFFDQGQATVNQLHAYVQDKVSLSDRMNIDFGIRVETHNHKGKKAQPQPLLSPGGWDQDILTAYDNGILTPSSSANEFDFTYNTLSYSIGWSLGPKQNLNYFARYSKGTKTPELNYYFSNFTGVDIPNAGPIQQVNQVEAGVKWTSHKWSVIPVLFYSRLSNVGSSNFVFDQQANTLFYTPIQFNSTDTYGLELESDYTFSQYFSLNINGVLQDPRANHYTVYNAKGTADTSDDEITGFDGNKLPFNPSILLHITPQLKWKSLSTYLTWTYMGSRFGNISNAFKIPAYQMVDAGIQFGTKQGISFGIHAQNVFNSEGLMNFFGPDFFGASKDDASPEYVQINPQSGFVVVPVLARMVSVQLIYSF